VNVYRLAEKLGFYLAMVCLLYAITLALGIQSFTASIAPSTDERDTPELPALAITVVAFIVLGVLAPSWLIVLTLKMKRRLRKRFSWIQELLIVVLGTGAAVLAIMNAGKLLSGELSVSLVLGEIFFVGAGILGPSLWVTLQVCRYKLKRHDQTTLRAKKRR